jgi:methionyl-tRNA synthetase
MLEPFLPNTAEKIWTYLNLAGSVHKKNWSEALKELKQGHKLKEPKPLFQKIEKKTIDEQKSLLAKGKLGSA